MNWLAYGEKGGEDMGGHFTIRQQDSVLSELYALCGVMSGNGMSRSRIFLGISFGWTSRL